jgi:hypothetical protein
MPVVRPLAMMEIEFQHARALDVFLLVRHGVSAIKFSSELASSVIRGRSAYKAANNPQES